MFEVVNNLYLGRGSFVVKWKSSINLEVTLSSNEIWDLLDDTDATGQYFVLDNFINKRGRNFLKSEVKVRSCWDTYVLLQEFLWESP